MNNHYTSRIQLFKHINRIKEIKIAKFVKRVKGFKNINIATKCKYLELNGISVSIPQYLRNICIILEAHLMQRKEKRVSYK